MQSIKEILDQLVGQRVPGGCEHCDAFQSMKPVHGIHVLTVHHDDWCPRLHRHLGREARS